MSRQWRLSSSFAVVTLRFRRSWMRWLRSRTERRLALERRRLTMLRQLVQEQELRVDRARASLRQVILPAPGVHPHLVENNQQGPRPPEPEYLVTPVPGQLPTVELVQPDPLSLQDRELTPLPEPEETQPQALAEIAQRLGLPPLPS